MSPNELIYFESNVPVNRCLDQLGKPRECQYSTQIAEAFIKMELGKGCHIDVWSLKRYEIMQIWIECSQDVRDKVGWRDWHRLTVLEYQHLLIPLVIRKMEEAKKQNIKIHDSVEAQIGHRLDLDRVKRGELDESDLWPF